MFIKYKGSSENPLEARIINNLTALYFCEIAMAIPKKTCLASLPLPAGRLFIILAF